MIRLEKVNGGNIREILSLKVAEEQKRFVSPNDASIIDAYAAITGNGQIFPFGIYLDNEPVGFLMIGYGTDDYWLDAPPIANGTYNIWRLMIDQKHQHKGYGRKAMELALQFIRSFPCGEAEICWLSYEPDNVLAKKLYSSMGFEETGEYDAGEIIAQLRL